MRFTSVTPWLVKSDYDAFKKLASDDPELPDSYDEWEEIANEQVSAFRKSGLSIETILITPEEVQEYCDACGIEPDSAGRAAVAMRKYGPKQK